MIDALTTFINNAGLFAPLYYICAFLLTALLPVIPTPLVAALGGTALGYGPAAVYGVIGLALGAMVSLTLARLVGRHLLQRLVRPKAWREWEQFLGIDSLPLWGLIFFLTNVDFAVMVAGLGVLPVSKLWLTVMIARLPWLLVSVWFGDVVLVNDTVAFLTLLLLFPGIYLLNRYRPLLQNWLVRLPGRSYRGRAEAAAPQPPASDVAEPRVENVTDGVPEKIEANY